MSWHSDDYLTILRQRRISPEDLNFFKTAPWARRWLEDEQYTTITTTSRIPKDDGEDDFFAKTINTASTIPHWLFLARRSFFSANFANDSLCGGPEQPEIVLLANLEQGMTGFHGTAYGGVLCCLLDEVISTCVELHRKIKTSGKEPLFTANLNTDFRRPVATPGPVILKSWLERQDGRKWFLKGTVEDVAGSICVQASGLWISARPQKM